MDIQKKLYVSLVVLPRLSPHHHLVASTRRFPPEQMGIYRSKIHKKTIGKPWENGG